MTEGFSLSAFDIFTAAGLLGYESVFGIPEDSLTKHQDQLRRQVRHSMRRLERKKLLRYDLTGVLHIRPDFRSALECLCQPHTVGLMEHNLSGGRKTGVHVLCSQTHTVLLEADRPERFRLRLTDTLPELLPRIAAGSVHEQMLLEEARLVKEQIASFDYEKAEKQLRSHVREPGCVPALLQVLSGTCHYVKLRVLRKEKSLYKTVYHSFAALAEDQLIRVSSDEYDVVSFDSTDPRALLGQFRESLEIQSKRGAQ